MRGEHPVNHMVEEHARGSSPHARGTQTVSSHERHTRGIIPACAGNTRRSARNTSTSRDHPRMRGEHDAVDGGDHLVEGSSPHARGTQTRSCNLPAFPGIIPACAGNTISHHSAPDKTRDHPRMRGEHLLGIAIPSFPSGSSPHARGTPSMVVSFLVSLGIIPACAGNTSSMVHVISLRRDHPRMRGEHRAGDVPRRTCWGSSPHARGTLWAYVIAD